MPEQEIKIYVHRSLGKDNFTQFFGTTRLIFATALSGVARWAFALYFRYDSQ